MHLVTFRRGRGEPKPGAVWHDAVLDLGGLGKELAAQRGTLRRGRGAFPRTLLELIRGGEPAWRSRTRPGSTARIWSTIRRSRSWRGGSSRTR